MSAASSKDEVTTFFEGVFYSFSTPFLTVFYSVRIMEADSTAPMSSSPDTAAPAPANPSQNVEDTKPNPVPSMSGALPVGDVKDSAEIAEDVGGGMHATNCLTPQRNSY